MAIVPFRNSVAADQDSPYRFISVGPVTMNIRQCSQKANALYAPNKLWDRIWDEEGGVQWPHDDPPQPQGNGIQLQPLCAHPQGPQQDPALVNVGMVVWQSGFVLSELLLRREPFGPWPGVKVLDLGTGTGITGIALALAGAQVMLTDLPHILPLTRENVAANCRPAVHKAVVAEHKWGTDARSILQQFGGYPDIITAADCIYETQFHPCLMATLQQCMGSHSVAYFSYRNRTAKEQTFSATASAHGFAAEAVPSEQLAEEYQTGGYCVLRLARVNGILEGQEGTSTVNDTHTSWLATGHSQADTCLHVGRQQGTDLDAMAEEQEELEHKPCAQS